MCSHALADYIDVSQVITNYSAAGIPLETMWTDIGMSVHFRCDMVMLTRRNLDYMDRRRIFTVDPQYFPMDRMREIVSYLHAHDQRYGTTSFRHVFRYATTDLFSLVLMTDPAVAYLPDQDYGPFDRGTEADVWLKAANNSSPFIGAVWPGTHSYCCSNLSLTQCSSSRCHCLP